MGSKVLLGLGSNIGDKIEFIKNAIDRISKLDLNILKKSNYYKSEPYGFEEQDWFVNSCLLVETNLSAKILLDQLKRIEQEIGRKKRERWHEREIDIDIILFSDLILRNDNLMIPHPDMEKRPFVLIPANEISPEMVHPILNISINELADKFEDSKDIQKIT